MPEKNIYQKTADKVGISENDVKKIVGVTFDFFKREIRKKTKRTILLHRLGRFIHHWGQHPVIKEYNKGQVAKRAYFNRLRRHRIEKYMKASREYTDKMNNENA